MAFSIGGLLSGIGTAVGIGKTIAGFFGGGSARRRPSASQAGPARIAFQGPPGFRPRAGGGFQRVALAPTVPFVVGGVRGFIAALLARASGAIGKRMSARSVRALINSLGLTAAAAALGLSVEEAAQIFAAAPKRRRRGITARDISTTKRVIGVTHRIQHELSHLAGPVRRAPRRHHHHK